MRCSIAGINFKLILGFGVSLFFLIALVACDKEDTQATNESVTNELVGEWALVSWTGGFIGINESYEVESSPRTITFQVDDDARNVVDKTDTTSITSNYTIQDVTSSNDTTFFKFSAIRGPDETFFLSGRSMYLVNDRVIETELICCDFFDYRFVKR